MTRITFRSMAILLALAAADTPGQSIKTDASWGRTAQTLTGPAYAIPQSLGKLAGNNLFHSFEFFNVNTGESAIFSTTTPSLQNVISRVSGGSASTINGLLQLAPAAGSAPGFFFINPAGVTFGAGATVDVPGAFHVSTANNLKFADGTVFSAGTGADSTFTVAAPQAFGFLGTSRASITITDGAILAMQPSQPISIVAGDIEFNNGAATTQGGDIRVAAVGQTAQDIEFTGSLPAAYGNLEIVNGGRMRSISFGPDDSGNVAVSAGAVTIGTDAYIGSDAGSTGNAGSVEISATGDLSVSNGGRIYSSAWSSGNAGSVKVSGGGIAIDGEGSIIYTQSVYGAGSAGNVEISATRDLSITGGGYVSSNTYGLGNAGSVKVTAGSIAIDYGGIASEAASGSTGNAGSVEVSAIGDLSVSNGGGIYSSAWSSGNAGSVKVSAGSIAIDYGHISGIAWSGSSGDAGNVEVSATGDLSLTNGAYIAAATLGWGNAGSVKVGAGSIAIDAGGFISSQTGGRYSGNGGSVEVSATENLSLTNGSIISDTSGWGNAGSVKVSAGSIAIDDGTISSNARSGSSGNGGSVDISTAGHLSISNYNGGGISADTYGSGNAGSVKASAGSIAIANYGGISSTARPGSAGDAGSVEVSAARDLAISNRGYISADTYSSGNAGSAKVGAGSIAIDYGTISSNARFGSSGDGGSVDVSTAGHLSIITFGAISSDTDGSGSAGSVKVRAGSIAIDSGQISSNAGYYSSGDGGSVDVSTAGHLSIIHYGAISSDTDGSGNAGPVKVAAGSMAIDNGSISSNAGYGSSGDAGSVDVSATGHLSINDGVITSNTYSSGNAGSVKVGAGSIAINKFGISSYTFGSGNAGSVTVGAGSIAIDAWGYISSEAIDGGAGNGSAGNVDVSATGNISISNYGRISTNASGNAANAGSVKVSAGSIAIDSGGHISSDALFSSTGNAGNVDVSATGNLSISNDGEISSTSTDSGNAGSVKVSAGNLSISNGGAIWTDSYYSGNAGSVKVSAANIAIDGQGSSAGISSNVHWSSLGDAGNIEVSATGALSLANGGYISSSTWSSSGKAGSVNVNAGTALVDGASSMIRASAEAGSSGQTGSVSVNAAGSVTISNGGELSIRNLATVADPGSLTSTKLLVSAPDITLKDAQITAASSGNVAASNIQVNFTNRLWLDPSAITTSANLGNGGSIDIHGGNLIVLDNSQITTSVLGASGNGGDISLAARALVMNTGFIQANTAAESASGGNVLINVGALIPSGNTLILGSRSAHAFTPGVFGYNVIEAASPSGLSGDIQVSSPALDLAGALGGLSTAVIDFGALGKDPCRLSAGSSLTPLGHGGLPPAASGPIRPEQGLSVPGVAVSHSSLKPIQLALNSSAPLAGGCR